MIEVRNLTRYYGDFAALQDVSFSINEGDIIGLLGLNGAGKSTTLKVLAGLIPPSAGTVVIDGVDMASAADAVKKRIGYLPEDAPLYKDMTVTSFLVHMGRLRGMSASEAKRRVPEVVALTQLEGRERQLIGTLSHGFKKRVGIAQCVIHNPRLVILDEPISGLDPQQIKGMRTVIRGMAQGRAVIVSSHIISEIAQTCDRVMIVHEGKLIAEGTTSDLTRDSRVTEVQVTVRGMEGVLREWLTQREDVESHVIDHSDSNSVTASITLTGDTRESLVTDLANAGFGVRQVEAPEGALERIFLDLVREVRS